MKVNKFLKRWDIIEQCLIGYYFHNYKDEFRYSLIVLEIYLFKYKLTVNVYYE